MELSATVSTTSAANFAEVTAPSAIFKVETASSASFEVPTEPAVKLDPATLRASILPCESIFAKLLKSIFRGEVRGVEGASLLLL